MKTIIQWWSGIPDHPYLSMAFAIMLYLYIRYRKFKRRGIAGLDAHPNYISALIVPFVEWIGKLLALAVMVYAILHL